MKEVLKIILKSLAISLGVYTLKKYLVKTAISVLKNERALKLLANHQEMIDDGRDKFFEHILKVSNITARILRWDDQRDALNIIMLMGISPAEYSAMDAQYRDKKLIEIIVKRSSLLEHGDRISTATMVYRFTYHRGAISGMERFQELAEFDEQSFGLNLRPGTQPDGYQESSIIPFIKKEA